MDRANEQRGEFDIDLAGKLYPMRPTWEAIVAFEAPRALDEAGKSIGGTGKSLQLLASEANRKVLASGDSAIIVTECVKAWARAEGDKNAARFVPEKVGPLLLQAPGGLLLVQNRLAALLFMAVTGGITASGEVKAATAKRETDDETGATTKVRPDGSAGSPARPSAGRRKASGKARR